MGCGPSRNDVAASNTVPKQEVPAEIPAKVSCESDHIHLASVLKIQRWFRHRRAMFERHRKASWKIFQAIEYKDEEEQVSLMAFFNSIVAHSSELQSKIVKSVDAVPLPAMSFSQEIEDAIKQYPLPPLSVEGAKALIEECELGQYPCFEKCIPLVAHYYRSLQGLPNVNHISTTSTKQICVVGDLHGQLYDLLIIFDKNGLPSDVNPYLFNGDLVDRGKNGLEVSLIVFYFALLYPGSVFVNRGNHEDYLVNKRYGFEKEIVLKYGNRGGLIMRAFSAVFTLLPLASIIDNKFLVVHAGVGTGFSISDLEKIDRSGYPSIVAVAKPANPLSVSPDSVMLANLTWSDPSSNLGCEVNTQRGGGSRWGSDVTAEVCKSNNFELIIRSHECQIDGYSYTHKGKVLTIFSASNYYTQSSNLGAYIKISSGLPLQIIQFVATKHFQINTKTLREKVGVIERAALHELGNEILKSKDKILAVCQAHDLKNTGELPLKEWILCMQTACPIAGVPWRSIYKRFVEVNKKGHVLYRSCLDRYSVTSHLSKGMEEHNQLLYSNLGQLEMVFRVLDADRSGYLTQEEFREACKLLKRYKDTVPLTDELADQFLNSTDLNHDGKVDFNEFVESFRLVHASDSNYALN